MSDSSCGVSSCGNNANRINENYRMAGTSGSSSFIKQERVESENYASESRSSGGDLDPNCQNEDLNDELQNEKVGKSSSASPVYQKLSKHSTGQLSNQQPDSQSSNNNNSVKIGKSSYRFFLNFLFRHHY